MSELPRGWAWATLADCCAVTLGQSPPGTSYNEVGEGVPFFQGKAEFGELRPKVRKWTTKPTKFAAEGDVLVSVRAPVGPTNLAPFECAIGRGLAAVHPLGGIDPGYVLYWIRASERQLARRGTGTTFGAVPGAVVRAHAIPVAPLAEQRRIVAVIEEQLSRLDAAAAAVYSAHKRLAQLAEATLDRTHGADVRELRYVAVDLRYGTSTKCSHDGTGSAVLRIPNIRDRRVDLSDLKRAVDPGAEVPVVEAGDLLFVRTNGSRDLIGRVGVVDDESIGLGFASYLIRARLDREKADPAFVALALSARVTRVEIERRAATSAGQYNLGADTISRLSIPLPDLDRQKSVRREIEDRLDSIARLRAELERARREAARLRRTILASAFHGELVRQDPNDEPASILLERIAAERAAAPRPQRKRWEKATA